MSNTSIGQSVKGSKHCVQKIINTQSLKERLDQQLGLGSIKWLSPLKSEDYREYKLNRSPISELLDFNDYSFWPDNQPQWDAIGLSGTTLVLVEAKAHPKELISKIAANSPESISLIKKSMQETFNAEYPNASFEKWINRYYQFGNRLTFLYNLILLLPKSKFDRVILVLLNIVEDKTHISTTLSEWKSHYNKVITELTGRSTLNNENIKLVFFNTKD